MTRSGAILTFCREALGLPESTRLDLQSLEGRGSDRTYFRLKWNGTHSAIVVQYDPKRAENAYQADIAVFLAEIGVPAPRLIRHDRALCLILMEDLGNTDLWTLRESPWEVRRDLYRKTLTAIRVLHSLPEKDFPSSLVKLMEPFGPELYRWERTYFIENFVEGVCAVELEPSFLRELETELGALAGRLHDMPRCLVHRDLQSQNVMIREGRPFFIDFQGMRFGALFYDLGSLLCDPYVDFTDDGRNELLSFYHGLCDFDLDRSAFLVHFCEASAQRLMQALGAYGFLGLKKGLTAYLRHIPAALWNLRRAASQTSSLPLLLHVTEMCEEAIERAGIEQVEG